MQEFRSRKKAEKTDEVKKKIEELKEYKKSVIFEAVTGKIKVV